jgi:hypothetical protein
VSPRVIAYPCAPLFGLVLTFYPSKWSALTQPDPTHGLVQYVSHDTAQSEGMAQVLPNGVAVLSVDNKTDLPLNTPRKSCVLCPQTFVEIPHAGN